MDNTEKFISQLDDQGLRMMFVICYALGERNDFATNDLSLLWKKTIKHYEVQGQADKWNKAIGFSYCFWEDEWQILPITSKDEFRQIAQHKLTSGYDEAYTVKVYDDQGRRLDVAVKEVTIRPELGVPKFDDWVSASEDLIARMEDAVEFVSTQEKRATALAKLTDEEKQLLGLND